MIFPFQFRSRRPASSRATEAMASSVTQIQITFAEKRAPRSVAARAPDFLATAAARLRERGLSRATISSTRYPARPNAGASTLATLPAPRIEMDGFFATDAVENNRLRLSGPTLVYSAADEEEQKSQGHFQQTGLQRPNLQCFFGHGTRTKRRDGEAGDRPASRVGSHIGGHRRQAAQSLAGATIPLCGRQRT